MEISRAIDATACAFILACWATDLRSRTIPNLLTGAVLVVAFVLQFLQFSSFGLLLAALGAGFNVAVLLAPWALGGVGGGDVKMMGAFGALVGPQTGLYGLAAGLVLGGLVAVAHLARIGRLREKLDATRAMVTGAARARSVAPLRLSAAAPDAVTLPYSLPLGAGALGVLLLMPTPQL